MAVVCLLFFTTTAHAAFTITRTSSPTHYIDKDITPTPTGMYAAYQIVSTTDITDAWVRIENFSSTSHGLAPNETGIVHLGPMTANVPMMAYFYLTGTETATAQTHDVKVYDRLPTAPGASTLATQNFTVTAVEDTIQANPNVVTALVSGPTPPTLGGIMTITVTGDTGTIGSAPGSNGPLVFTPAAFPEWPANAYQLYSTTITFSGGNSGTYYDTLYFAGLANASTTSYVAVYTFRAITVTTAPTAVSPVAYLASGTQMKHTALDSNYYTLAALAPIQPATNTLTMSKSVNIGTLPNSGGTVTYTLRLDNVSSTYAASLDSITDTLPASTSYVAGSSTFNGAAIGDPVASGSNRTWYRSFVIPAASYRDLVFQATLPATPGTYTNSAYGTMGATTQIDTTITTADSAPATASTIVLSPPVLSKGFTPNSIPPSGTSTLTFTITNPNSSTAISGVAFTDTLPVAPAAMTLASPSTTNTCGGTLTDNAGNPPVAGSASVKLAGGSIAASGSCSITVQVTAGTSGTYNNTTGTVSSTTAGTGLTASASLEVSNKPSITKSFAPGSISSGGTSVLTLTITNNYAGSLSNMTFTDTFPVAPAAMTAANPLTTSNTCGGNLTNDTGGALIAGSPGIKLNNGSLAASTSCTVTIAVTASTKGTYSNTSGGVATLETSGAGANSNTAQLTVLSPPNISKAFSPTTVAINSPSTLTVTLTNPNTGAALTGVGFNDIFPTSPGAMTLASATTTNTCGGTQTDNANNPLAIGSTSIKLENGSIAAGGSCIVSVSVQAAATGTYTNATGNVTSTEGGAGGAASANLVVDLQPTFTKSFSTNPVLARGTSDIIFSIKNNSAGAINTVVFTDVFPTFPGQMSLASATITNNGQCGTVTVNDSGGGAINIGDVGIRVQSSTIAAGATCTITATVKTLVGGSFRNTTSTLTSSGVTANAATASLNVYTLSKLFNPNPILPTATTTLRLTATNPDTVNSISGVGFADIFPTTPAQMSLASAAYTNTCGGTVTDNANNPLAVGSTSVKLVGGSVGPNTDCSVLVTVKLNTATVGTYVNTAGIDSTDNLVVTLTPTAAKSFAPSTIAVNGASVMTIVLTNNTALGALSGVAFTDTYPAGLINATSGTVVASNTCGGTVTAVNSGGSVSLTGGAITTGAASTCTITVNVTSATGGTYNNTTSGVSSTQSGPPGPVSNTATLLVQIPAPGATKSFSPSGIAQNDPTQMTIAFTNPNAVSITNVAFIDTYPADLMNASSGPVVASNTCGGVVIAVNSGTSLSLSGGAIPVGGCSIVSNVTATTLGNKVNSTGSITSGNAVTNTGVSGTLSVVNRPLVAKSFSPASTGVNNASVLTITLTNPNSVAITGAAFSDTYPAGLVSTATPSSATTCTGGTVSAPAGGGYVTLSSGTIPASGSCTVTVNVSSAATGTYTNSTGPVTTTSAGTGTAASATLTVIDVPTVLKSFSPATISANGTSLLTITLTNPNAVPVTGAAFTDTYPANLVNTATPNGATLCTGGTVTAAAGGGSLALSNGIIPPNGSCTVTVNVTSATTGTYSNSTGPVTTTNAGAGSSASATLTVVSGPSLLVMKAAQVVSDPVNGGLSPKAIPGAVMEYSVIVTNSGAGMVDSDSTVLTDAVPPNMTLYVDTGSGDPVTFSCSAVPLCGLTFNYGSNVRYTDAFPLPALLAPPNACANFTYAPSGSYDANVRGFCINPSGTLSGSAGPPDPQFTVKYRMRIN